MTEENKLIAEFMGLKEPYELPQFGTIRPNGDFKTEFTSAQLKYHSSWEWLMPVVEKILDISFQDEGDEEDFYSIRDCIPDRNHTYKAVVEFIKWYNKNK
jgi:hypothetical protein